MTSADPEELAQVEREAWDSVSGAWSKWWRVMDEGAQPVNARLVALAGVAPGQRVLDVASGLGEPSLTAARAVGPEGSVLGIDLSPGMVRLARERAERAAQRNVQYRDADIQAVELPPGTFDAAVSRWGVMLVPDPARALTTVRTALRPGARFAAAVWGDPARSPILSLARRVLESDFGHPPADPDAPGPFRLHRAGQLAELFEQTGYGELREDLLELRFRFANAEEYARWVSEMSSSLRKTLDAFEPEERARYWQVLAETAGELAADDSSLELSGSVVCVSGCA